MCSAVPASQGVNPCTVCLGIGWCYYCGVMKQDRIKVNSLVEVVQSTRVVSGSLRSDTDMAGALCLAAGNCWLQQSKNGRCQVLYMTELSKEECCKTGRLGTSWTEEDVPNSTLFKWLIFNGGAPHCIPCKGRALCMYINK